MATIATYARLQRQLGSLSGFAHTAMQQYSVKRTPTPLFDLFLFFLMCGWRLNQWLFPIGTRPSIQTWTELAKRIDFRTVTTSTTTWQAHRCLQGTFPVPLPPNRTASPRHRGCAFQSSIQHQVNQVTGRVTTVPLPWSERDRRVWDPAALNAVAEVIVRALVRYGVAFVASEISVVLGRGRQSAELSDSAKLSARLDQLVVRGRGLAIIEMKYQARMDGPRTRDVAQVMVQALALHSTTGIWVRDCFLLYYNESEFALYQVEGGSESRPSPIAWDLMRSLFASDTERLHALEGAIRSLSRRLRTCRRQRLVYRPRSGSQMLSYADLLNGSRLWRFVRRYRPAFQPPNQVLKGIELPISFCIDDRFDDDVDQELSAAIAAVSA